MGIVARLDPHRDWGAIASPISLVRVDALARAAGTVNTAAPRAVVVGCDPLVGRKRERATTKTAGVPAMGSRAADRSAGSRWSPASNA